MLAQRVSVPAGQPGGTLDQEPVFIGTPPRKPKTREHPCEAFLRSFELREPQPARRKVSMAWATASSSLLPMI